MFTTFVLIASRLSKTSVDTSTPESHNKLSRLHKKEQQRRWYREVSLKSGLVKPQSNELPEETSELKLANTDASEDKEN